MDDTTTITETDFDTDDVLKERHFDKSDDAKEQHEQEEESEEGSESPEYDSDYERRSDEEFERDLDQRTFECDGYWKSGMDGRIEDLGIVPDFWKERERNKKKDRFRLARFLEKFPRWKAKHIDKPPLQISVDIATCIMHELPDLDTLGHAIFINKSFATGFKASSKSIIRSVIFNMFGESSFEYALMLGVLCHANSKGSLKDENGKIPLAPPSPQEALGHRIITGINMIYLTVTTWVDLWETRDIWVKKRRSREYKVERLSKDSKSRFIRAILLFWVYADCARNTLERDERKYPCSTITLEGTGVLDGFSHLELLETRAIFDFFYKLVRIACQDYHMEDSDKLYVWQSYCLSLGPMWMLKLLAYHQYGFEATGYEGEDEGFFLYHVQEELETRGISGLSAGFTDQEHEALVQALKERGIDGNSRPTAR